MWDFEIALHKLLHTEFVQTVCAGSAVCRTAHTRSLHDELLAQHDVFCVNSWSKLPASLCTNSSHQLFAQTLLTNCLHELPTQTAHTNCPHELPHELPARTGATRTAHTN